MALWRLDPVARSDDPRWLDHPRFKTVVVRAETAALARLVAGAVEHHAIARGDPAPGAVGNESPADVAGLLDEKLYRVTPLPPEEQGTLAEDGPDAVLEAERADGRPVGAPPQSPEAS